MDRPKTPKGDLATAVRICTGLSFLSRENRLRLRHDHERKGRRPTKLHVPGPMSAAMAGSKSLMSADEVFVRTDLEVHPLSIPAQALSPPFRHHRRRSHSLVPRLVEANPPADQHGR